VNTSTITVPGRPLRGERNTRVGGSRGSSETNLRDRFERDVLPLLDMLHSIAHQWTRSSVAADDLLQETLIKAYVRFHTFDPETHIKAWLVQIMRNTWIDAYRRSQRRPPESLTDDVGSWERYAYDRHAGQVNTDPRLTEFSAEVSDAIHMLSQNLQRVVYYAYVQGFRYKDIAQIECIPIGTVMSRLHRARGQLQASLGNLSYAASLTRTESRDDSREPIELASVSTNPDDIDVVRITTSVYLNA
jgi:RNA polymerase sigma-70 factor (ECF subfamily)